ncbi:hypothetical protein [Staphylococcus saprophyticus]|uniref:hypothetical protein n=1 Tax=Staphylococcus saprophyticus TaxID=29385 RepID=UPI0034DD54DE
MNSETKFHVSVMDARLKKVKKQCDQYKKAYQHCVDDLIVLRANNERLERENECEKEWFYKYSCELEHIVKHERDTIKRLERENEKYIKLLKEFNNLINYKLAIHPGSDVYMYYRSELNKLGVK